MNKVTKVLWGIVFVALGVLFALNALEITNFDMFFKGWWTLLIIIPSVIGLFADKNKTVAIVGLCVGLVLLLGCLGYIDFKMIAKLIIPVIVILIGLKLIFGEKLSTKKNQAIRSLKNMGGFKYCSAYFKSKTDDCANQVFRGADYVAVAGKLNGDVSNSMYERDVLIKAKGIFGTVNVIVPNGVNVITAKHTFFGSITNSVQNNNANVITIYIDAYSVFGEVRILTPSASYAAPYPNGNGQNM